MLKQVDHTAPLSKYYQISESIKENIITGKYKVGQKLPTYRALSKYFNTTMVTISNAVKLLESEGYIYKVTGNGMFVQELKDKTPKSIKFKKTGLLMPVKGDLYQNMTDVFIHKLEEFDYEAIPLGIKMNAYKSSIESKEKLIKKYIERGFESLIINGDRHFPYKLLHKYKNYFRQLNFITEYESALDFPEANIITTDYEKIGYLGGKHLIKQGQRKIIFLTYEKLSSELCKRLGTKKLSSDLHIADGIERAMLEAEMRPDISIIRSTLSSSEEDIKTRIKELIKQDNYGIMTHGDSRAMPVYHAINELEKSRRKNCSIVGLYDTSWANVFKPQLTSISINEHEIGRLTAQAVIEGWKGKKIKVEPKLIVRET